MKTKLLSILTLTSLMAFAQSPINSFYTEDGASYAILSSTTPLDQSASGTNVVWNFSDLTPIGSSSDDNSAPIPDEVSQFPNTTNATRNTSIVNLTTTMSNIYSKNISNEVSITGIANDQVTLNFAANNAKLGTFPLNYGYSLTDNLAGTYNYDTYSGNLDGTITTSVDAYGTLTLTVNGIALPPQTVTRLKSVQNISLDYGFIPNVGTIDQTVYSYYVSGSISPVFRTSTTHIVVGLLSIDQTAEQYERYVGNLGIDENVADAGIAIFPNPVEDVLHIGSTMSQNITGVTISDMSGRVVLQSKSNIETLSIGHLQSGMYLATVSTAKGSFTQKIMKR